jgi:hypothetical protein
MDIRRILSLTQAEEVDGIYVFEIDPPRYIKGRAVNVVGIVGEFERGTMGQRLRIGSSKDFLTRLGGYGVAPAGEESTWDGYGGFKAVSGKVWPSGLRIVRPDYDNAAASTVDIPLVTHVADPLTQGRSLTLTARSKGRYGDRITAMISDASDASLTDGFKLVITLDDESEVIDNLYAAMTTAQLVERFRLAGLELADPSIADDGTAVVDAWPETYTLTGGSDGDAAAQAWTDAIDLLLADREVGILFCAEPPAGVTAAVLNAYIKSKVGPTAGAGAPVTAVLAGPAGDDIDAAALEAAQYRNDELLYVWPWRYQVYAGAANTHTDGKVLVPGNDAVAAALAAIGPDRDVSGPEGTEIIHACTSGLEFENRTRADYVTANQQGICGLEHDPDLGYRVRTPITTDLTPGKELIYRTRMKDYLNFSIAGALKFYAGQPITPDWEEEVTGAIQDFLDGAKRDALIRDFSVDVESVNTDANIAKGIYRIKVKIQLWGIARSIVLMSQVGASVEIESVEEAA